LQRLLLLVTLATRRSVCASTSGAVVVSRPVTVGVVVTSVGVRVVISVAAGLRASVILVSLAVGAGASGGVRCVAAVTGGTGGTRGTGLVAHFAMCMLASGLG